MPWPIQSIIALFSAVAFACFQLVEPPVPVPVPVLEQERYLGHWYQMYSDLAVELSFENNSYCVTADYGLNANGTVSVLNRERQDSVTGASRRILGWASAPNASAPGELQVHLQTTEFAAPYWVLALGPPTWNGSQYEYSVVSDPLRLTLFVLARNVTEFNERWDTEVRSFLEVNGFNQLWNTPVPTVQDGCEDEAEGTWGIAA